MTPLLVPALTLADLYGPGHVFVPRVHPACARWLLVDPALCDGFTGAQLAVAGAMPILCSAGVTIPEGLELLEEAGLAPPPHRKTYRGDAELETAVRHLASDGWTLVLQNPFPSGAVPEGASWIDPALHAFLNNKANLGSLVPAEATPRRELVEPRAVFADPPAPPFVLKVATDLPNGGGFGVALCREPGDIARAHEALGTAERLVLEEWLPMAANLSVHFTVGRDGSVRYQGSAPQHVDAAGRYGGNWIPMEDPAPASAVEVGTTVARRAASMGYFGWVGIDMAVLEDGSVRAFDLNFRVNGSTATLLLANAIRSRHPGALLRYRSWRFQGRARELAGVVRGWVREGRLVPLCVFDPEAAGHPGQVARLTGILVGEDRREVEALEGRLGALGLG